MSTDRSPTNVPPPANPNFDHRHRFRRGHNKMGGRRKGTPNVTTNHILEAILGAPERVGSDGRGKVGANGFYDVLAREHPTLLATLIAKALSQLTEKSQQELQPANQPAVVFVSEAEQNL